MPILCLFVLVILQAGTGENATWFTPTTLFTAAGSTAAVIAVTTVLQRFSSKLPAKWFALGLAEILALMAVSVQHQKWDVVNGFVAILNGLMTYAAAVGVNTAATAPPPAVQAKSPGGRSYRWWI